MLFFFELRIFVALLLVAEQLVVEEIEQEFFVDMLLDLQLLLVGQFVD